MPDGMPMRSSASGSEASRVASCTTVPAMRAATAMHSERVSGSARCTCPRAIMRAVRSTLPALIGSPESSVASTGGATKPMAGLDSLPAASVTSRAIPIATHAALRIAASFCITSLLASSASGSSMPLNPRSRARTNTHELAASTIDTSILPTPGTSSVSRTLPVGSSLPVVAPPGDKNSSRTGAPVPETPGMATSPSTAALPSSSEK